MSGVIIAAIVNGKTYDGSSRSYNQGNGEHFVQQPSDGVSQLEHSPNPHILYGPHGYSTFSHSICQEVPTVDVAFDEMEGDWYLVEYVNSHDGKPIGPHTPYLCPEARISIDPTISTKKMNVSQISYEWPAVFLDTVEWTQHKNKTSVFFHEENIFSLWTMKIMEFNARSHMVVFLCIDYTIWPGWNHRGVYIYSREPVLKTKVRRKLSDRAHRRMRMEFDRKVNTTTCNPDDYLDVATERFHPHRKINTQLYRAPVHPYINRNYRRNKKNLD
jgi:hypothetical protein